MPKLSLSPIQSQLLDFLQMEQSGSRFSYISTAKHCRLSGLNKLKVYSDDELEQAFIELEKLNYIKRIDKYISGDALLRLWDDENKYLYTITLARRPLEREADFKDRIDKLIIRQEKRAEKLRQLKLERAVKPLVNRDVKTDVELNQLKNAIKLKSAEVRKLQNQYWVLEQVVAKLDQDYRAAVDYEKYTPKCQPLKNEIRALHNIKYQLERNMKDLSAYSTRPGVPAAQLTFNKQIDKQIEEVQKDIDKILSPATEQIDKLRDNPTYKAASLAAEIKKIELETAANALLTQKTSYKEQRKLLKQSLSLPLQGLVGNKHAMNL